VTISASYTTPRDSIIDQPTLCFVPVRTEPPQVVLLSHRAPDVLVRQLAQFVGAKRAPRQAFDVLFGQTVEG
jgi:hypothetical protein